MSQLTFMVNGIEVHGNSREPLLTQLERVGIQPEYQCRSGMCGACRCTLTQGAVEQEDNMAFIAKNEILACCSVPKTNLTIEFNYQLVGTTLDTAVIHDKKNTAQS
ncbi:class I ribonucleotide reductase maintenance protein YfaE [Photobacterium nomapromontoriensis]|uniref:class I ribonucleotide reductase maintenance protein YfaE n=1 Tax=Photobacterium nomapromontoriensis TaxID=2910237 RepID=UPI003D0B2DA8